jgi:hypothetical protein
VWWGILDKWGSTNRKNLGPGEPKELRNPISKITNTKRIDRVVQVAEHLPSETEALHLNTNITKTNKTTTTKKN